MLEQAKPILATFRANGFDAYIVGGAVRDWLLNTPLHDVDLATSARPEEVQDLFPETVPVGLKHGTVLVIYEGIPYEVTTFRSESSYSDYRHPDSVKFETSIEKDLERRDFTINAMAMDEMNQIMDPFNGQEDLKVGQLRTVGDAVTRFREDPLRMLRAARFVSQLDFVPTQSLKEAMEVEAESLSFISIERVQEELTKCLKGRVPYKALDLVAITGLDRFIPMFSSLKDALRDLALVDFSLLKTDVERWCLLLLLMKIDSIEDFLAAYRFSSKMKRELVQLFALSQQATTAPLSKELLYTFGLDHGRSVERLKAARRQPSDEAAILERFERMPIKSRKDLNVNGRDLMKWTGQEAGPWLTELFSEIENQILNGKLVHSKERIQRWVQTEWMTKR